MRLNTLRTTAGLIATIAVIAGLLAASTQVDRAATPGVISINFAGGVTMGATEIAGVVAKSNWNNASGPSSSSALALKDETGTLTAASVTWSAPLTWTTPVANQAGNRRLMKGYLDTTNTTTPTLSVSGLALGPYDIYVYVDGDNGSATRTAAYRISGSGITTTTINVTDAANTNFDTTFVQANNSNGNYVKFSINATGFTLTATPGTATDSTKRSPVNGLQIVPTGTPAPTFSTSGLISSAADGAGATVTIGSQSAVADGSGNYTVSGLANGTYTVVPSKSGYTFAPTSRSVTVNGANVSAINFTASATPPTNHAPVVSAGADRTITLPTNSTTLTGTASDDGLPSPPAALTYAWSMVSGPAAVTFSAPSALSTLATFSTTGTYTLRLTASDSALASSDDVVVIVNPASSFQPIRINAGGSAYTDTLGQVWSADKYFSGGSTGSTTASINGTVEDTLYQRERYGNFSYAIPIANGAYTLKLHFAEIYWTGAGKRVFDVSVEGVLAIDNLDIWAAAGANTALIRTLQTTVTDGTLNINFVTGVDNAQVSAIEVTAGGNFSLGGTISPSSSGTGTTLALTGAAVTSVVANASGNYTFNGLGNGTYTVTPSKAGYVFSPSSQTATISGASITALNFTAAPAPTYAISGTITPTATGAGATVNLGGSATGTTTADSSGHYSFSGLSNGNYAVMPSKAGYAFSPSSRNLTIAGGDVAGIDFTVSVAPTYSISGTITPTASGGAGATVTLSGAASATITTDGSGNYTFPGLTNGAYTVTPSGAGYAFTPTSRSATINGANVTGVNFTVTGTAFYDDFTGTALDPAWVAVDRRGDYSNNEPQCYHPANAVVSGGYLSITAKAEQTTCTGTNPDGSDQNYSSNYSSAFVMWRNFNFRYGTLEIRAKLTGGTGPWPALWLLGSDCQPGHITGALENGCNWPNPGSDEIDMTEILNSNLTTVNQQIHSGSNNAGCQVSTSNVSQNWHTYTMVWSAGSIVWKIDGTTTCTKTSAIPSSSMFLMMNVAVGGNGGGSIVNSTLPQTMTIDYVKLTQP